jgi:L-alanine-DL-glutamate epimerase-like enolase superfamily enzyme
MQIAAIETFSLSYRTVGRFKFFEGRDGHPTGRPTILVKLINRDGITGWGQCVPIPKWSYETPESVKSTIDLYLGPALLNRTIESPGELHQIMNEEIAGSFSTGMPMAKAGVDLAFHDLLGKAKGAGIPELWGRTPRASIELSWTLNPACLDDVGQMIEEGRSRGYQHFNLKVAPNLDLDLELCRKVKAAAPEGFLWVDANGGYDPETALVAAPKLADIGVDVLEQPIRANEIRGYRALKKQGALPIIMDEGVVSLTDLEEFAGLGLLDGVAMKPARCGGLYTAERQIKLLESLELMVLGSGLTDPDLSLAASLLLYGAYDYSLPAALNGPQFLAESVLSQPLQPNSGRIDVPTGQGLGVSINVEKLEELSPSSAGL